MEKGARLLLLCKFVFFSISLLFVVERTIMKGYRRVAKVEELYHFETDP